jgi:hypothetical protein
MFIIVLMCETTDHIHRTAMVNPNETKTVVFAGIADHNNETFQ